MLLARITGLSSKAIQQGRHHLAGGFSEVALGVNQQKKDP
jgi:hypothetical protein